MSICPERARGATLIELIVSIVIISVALTGVLLAINRATRLSVQPMVQAQAVAVAESYLDEILMRAWRDPDDPSDGCASPGAEAGETRDSFDDITDYHGLEIDGRVRNQFGELIQELAAYRVSISISCADLGDITAASGQAARIEVQVRNTALATPVVLRAYRAEAP
ncbi:prepilin-type N-terminal cleavage/methylation domain-containing protein [Alkalilimnicola sp. S0819]|uniref:type IV pilus modification PilV family protein n=1 Tax=Alkalilimnicola sp. S0819 TaxID=2613922 RepID=UPI0012617E85|nr:prepilin-type N-terminal cleavage/methylation domain-containing protein [Alkalilimnicola sp. S0819]KAB7622632.1 prepilin-type N-terminal cleavage/methylation domain-containing protein [Alkalilimnicola sp. S0819]MPQ17403.1 prepilin-type N-terminal cleavage/methylation domain-containing protein [Alkalilimnicola sp. S0819]